MTDLALEPGSDADILAEIRDRTGTLADPVGVVFTVTDPTGQDTVFTYPTAGITKVSTGVYRLTFTIAMVGQHFVTCASTTPSRVVTTTVHGAATPA